MVEMEPRGEGGDKVVMHHLSWVLRGACKLLGRFSGGLG
jgi:hypothetical protein